MPNQEEGNSNQKDTNPRPVSINQNALTPDSPTGHMPDEGAETTDHEQHATKHRTYNTVLQVGLLVIGAVYSFLAYQQWQAMNTAADLQSKALHVDQRAWVAESDITGKPAKGELYKVTVVFKNTGKTPAKQRPGVSASCFRMKEISDPDPDFEKEVVTEAAGNIFTKALIPPNGAFQQELNPIRGQKLTDDDISRLSDPTLVMLVFGKVVYSDIFGCEHWSTYCYRAYPDGTFVAYGPYNDSDENHCP